MDNATVPSTSPAATQALGSAHFDQVDDGHSQPPHNHGSSELLEAAPEPMNQIGKKESKRVTYTRILVIVVMAAVAAVTSIIVYNYSSDVEQDTFETYFDDMANKITTEFLDGATRRISAIEGLADQITSFAVSSNATNWPNIALPDFERRGRRTMFLSDVLSVIFFPIVTKEERASWEAFSVENQAWLKDGLATQGIPEEEYNQEWIDTLESICGERTPPDLKIIDEIFKISGAGAANETGDGPYAPFWQVAPCIPVACQVNYNGFSHPNRVLPLNSVLQHHKALVTRSWDYRDSHDPSILGKRVTLNLFLQHGGNQDVYEAGPASDIYVPVFTDFDKKEVGGEITGYVYWQVYFENILSARDIGVYVVLENNCNQTYTYRLDGRNASYVGEGELYDHDYESYGTPTDFGSFIHFEGDENDLPDGQCLYRIRVYPSEDLEDTFLSRNPLRFAFILAATFLFTSLVFLLYDYLVEKRQRLVLNTAVKSTAVVDSLFPAEVRDRLYQKETTKHKDGKKAVGPFSNAAYGEQTVKEDEDDDPHAIADLYPNCSVLFCDIVGFTNWASTREPRDVFKLLETLYKAFDKTAARLDVFKVETIGDCYVAATGLPNPQQDHARLMAMFASECILKVPKVLHRLTEHLGADTANLTVRIGMHSGPVTAGVLRGAKARFQLFGDTVNTAARMESNGLPHKIHISASTAEQLVAGGLGEWVEEREEKIDFKGKGILETFWLKPMNYEGSTTNESNSET